MKSFSGYITRLFLASFFIAFSFSVARAESSPCTSTSSVKVSGGVGKQCVTAAGTVDYDWIAPPSGVKNSLGTIAVSINGESKFGVSPAIFSSQGDLEAETSSVSGDTISITYMAGSSPLYIQITPSFDGGIFVAVVAQDTSRSSSVKVRTVELGSWPYSISGYEIPVPYYTQTIHYFTSLNVFANMYWDPFMSHATTFEYDTTPQYLPTTSGRIAPLYERMELGVSPEIENVFPNIHNAPSPFMQKLAGRLVVHADDGNFATIASNFATLADHGINNCVTIIHDWQRAGYDNELPLTYPASSALGGNSELLAANNISTGMGCYASLHENYADYYPNYPRFTKNSISLNGDGSLIKGWTNAATGIEAYVAKPTWFVPNAETQSPLIQANLGTSATYLDVNSANPPWHTDWVTSNQDDNEYHGIDADASSAGGGIFSAYIKGSQQLWEYERTVQQGPVFGEGKDHWFWSGMLDGVEAQVGPTEGMGTLPGNLGTQTPLFVDFDLRKIHPLQVNHGMGHYIRWAGNGESVYRTNVADAYRMQEVIFGHAPMMSEPGPIQYLWALIPRVLQEQRLVSPLAWRNGQETVSHIQYQVNGNWTNTSQAAVANNFTRPQVTYNNGDTIIANAQEAVMTVDGLDLPQYGWVAEGYGLLAYTAMVDGVVADYAQTPYSYYANARNANDLAALGCGMGVCLDAQGNGSTLVPFAQLQSAGYDPSSKEMSMRWTLIQSLNPKLTYEQYVKVVDGSGRQVGLKSSYASTPDSPWLEGQVPVVTIPIDIPSGNYTLYGAICDTGKTGEASGATTGCVLMNGSQDSKHHEYFLGTLSVSGSSAHVTAAALPVAVPDARLNMKGNVLNFGTILTDGMVMLDRDTSTNTWTLQEWPRFPHPNTGHMLNIQINNTAIGMPGAILCDSTNGVEPTPVSGTSYWQISVPPGTKSCVFNDAGTSKATKDGSDVALSKTDITFSGVFSVGSQSSQQTVTLTNISDSVVAIGNISISGQAPSSFKLSNGCGKTMGKHASCSLGLVFAPTVGGALTGTIAIADSAGDQPQLISLAGTAKGVPAVKLSAVTANFNNQEVGTTSPVQVITLKNSGTNVLTISSINLGGANPSAFHESHTCGSTLGAGESCSIDLSCTPGGEYSQSATLTLVTNAPSSPNVISLSGAGVAAPKIGVSAVSGQGTNPKTAVLGRKTTFYASIEQSTSTALTWTLEGAGTFSNDVYTAPSSMPSNKTVKIIVSLTYDPGVRTTYTMTLVK